MRSTTRLAVASVLALPLLVLACGSVATAPGISPDDAPARLAPAICSGAWKCCTASQLMNNTQAGTDEATCESKTETALENQVAGIKASEKQGRVVYDGTKVQACVDTLNSASCSELQTTNHFSGIPACASFLQPKVALGGACSSDFECIDAYCDKTGVASGADGACHALVESGASCANGGECDTGLACDATAMTCMTAPTTTPPASAQCFYASGCSTAGAGRSARSLLDVALLMLAVALRPRALSRDRRRPTTAKGRCRRR